MIETERLLLRRPTEADVESPPSWLSDPEVMDWLGGVEPPAEVVRLWLDQWEQFPSGKFLVERRSDGAVIGRVGANYYDVSTWRRSRRRRARARLGARREHWGHGYATEAALAVREWLQAPRVISLITAENVRSQRVAERLGARPEQTVELPGHGRTWCGCTRDRDGATPAAEAARRGRAEHLAVAYADPEACATSATAARPTSREVEEGIAAVARALGHVGRQPVLARAREDGRVLGRAGFLRWDPETWEIGGSETELGWVLAREHWGQGYATEAALALRDWAFDERGLTRLISLIQQGTWRSVRVAESRRAVRTRRGGSRQTHQALLPRAMTELRPLAGTSVVDVTSSLAGPTATQLLAALGADVVKVEPLAGDHARAWGPPFLDGEGRCSSPRTRASARWPSTSETTAAATIVLRLADRADVFVQSLRPGAAERHGLGADELRARNPRLVYCSIGAFGARGPLSGQPGYDPLLQAASGIMSVTGEDDRPPVRVGVSLIDLGTGVWAALGVLAALTSASAPAPAARSRSRSTRPLSPALVPARRLPRHRRRAGS